jgi:hypothetical protein
VTAAPLSHAAFYESAQRRALGALQAHHEQDYGSVALNAGTALEHLAKACLVKRSPALITELRREQNYSDLLQLLGYAKSDPERPLRTVGLRDALDRIKVFVIPNVAWRDLLLLAGMRNGTAHAAMDDAVETSLLVAFVAYADELLKDLDRDRREFWGAQLTVVDALLANASDRVLHAVAVKIAEAKTYFIEQYDDGPPGLLELTRQWAEPQGDLGGNEVSADCPACDSLGIAYGTHEVEWDVDEWAGELPASVSGKVWFIPSAFACEVCRLRLVSMAEAQAAGLGRWEVEDADPRKYEEQADLDGFYERYGDRY